MKGLFEDDEFFDEEDVDVCKFIDFMYSLTVGTVIFILFMISLIAYMTSK